MLETTTHTIDCSSSTAVDSATYDSATEHLTIAFGHGTYRYGNVDQAMYGFLCACARCTTLRHPRKNYGFMLDVAYTRGYNKGNDTVYYTLC